MPEKRVILRNTRMSAVEETTEGTPATELATSAVLLHADGAEFNLERDLVENDFMTGSLSRTAPSAGMWSDDLGPTINSLMRGKGILTKPDYSMFLKSIMGLENQSTDVVVDALSTTTNILIKSGGDPVVGQLVYFPATAEVSRVTTLIAGTSFKVWPPLATAPSEDDDVTCGTNWMLASDDHPSFTAYSYFDGPKRLRYSGCKCVSAEFDFQVGANVPITFTSKALSPTYDNEAQAVTPIYDQQTVPLKCLGITLNTTISAVATGTPTTTETILLTPDFDVAVNDMLIADVGGDDWETVAISAVSGDAGSNIELTHAALSSAVSAGDSVFVVRDRCATVGSSLGVSIAMEDESELCMQADYGRTGRVFTSREITMIKTPYFKSWQDFLMRDSVKGSAFMITLGDTAGNIFSIYGPNQVVQEASLTTDPLMMEDVTTRAVVDSLLGPDNELVMAAF